MTDNQKQPHISSEEIEQRMQDRYAYMLYNEQYYERHADEHETLEEFVCDVIDDGSDEHERLEQAASNRVLIDWATADTDSADAPGDSRGVGGSVPSGRGLVTPPYLCNSSQDSAFPGSSEGTPKIKHGGFDGGAKNCFFGTWNEEAFTTLIGACESGKTSALRARQCNPDAELKGEIITLAGRDVSVYPSGSRIGVYYEYHIEFEGFGVFIHKDKTPKNNNPQIWVDYRAESILKYGSVYRAQTVLLDFLSALSFTKFEERGERVSRLDIQVMIDVPVRAFVNLYLADHDVSKGRDFKINGKKKRWGKLIETFETGNKSRVQLCFYDKRAEIVKKYNAETALKYEMTKDNIGADLWQSDHPITRIEFRLGREALKALGVESLEDFRVRELGIIQFLTHNWFRLLEKPKVRGTEDTAAIHPLWVRVQKLFKQYFSCADIPPEQVQWEKPTRLSTDTETLRKQGAGCFAGAAAPIFGVQKSVAALTNRLRELAAHSVNEDVLEKYNKRVRLIEVEKGVQFGESIASEMIERSKAIKRFDNPELRLRE